MVCSSTNIHFFVQLKGLTKQQRRQISKECIRLTDINPSIVEEAINTATPHNSQIYKQYLTCSYVLQGYQNKNGEILYDNIRDFLLEHYNLRDANYGVDSCRRIKDQGSPEENAFKALQCILENLKALDENAL